jgi:hypothetical protein
VQPSDGELVVLNPDYHGCGIPEKQRQRISQVIARVFAFHYIINYRDLPQEGRNIYANQVPARFFGRASEILKNQGAERGQGLMRIWGGYSPSHPESPEFLWSLYDQVIFHVSMIEPAYSVIFDTPMNPDPYEPRRFAPHEMKEEFLNRQAAKSATEKPTDA